MHTSTNSPPSDAPMPVGAGIDWSDPNSPLAPVYLRTVQVLAVAFLLALFAISTQFPLWHTDIWGHVRYGQWMVEHGRIPDREPFCPWWDGRVPFTQFYTLSQTVLYLVYAAGATLAGGDALSQQAGGVEFLRYLHALLNTGRYGVLMLVFVRLCGSWNLALIGAMISLLLDLSNLAVIRPQGFGQLFFALLLWPLSRSESLSVRSLLLIPGLLVVWANTHGSYLTGLALLGCMAVGRTIDASGRVWTDLGSRRLWLVLVLSILAIAIGNPYGPDFFRRTLDMAKHPSLSAAISEWQPLIFSYTINWHVPLMLSLGLLAVSVLRAGRPQTAGPWLALGLFGIGVALQNRFVIWWALLVPWVLVGVWKEFWPTEVRVGASFRKTMLAGLVAGSLFMWSSAADWLRTGHPRPLTETLSAGTPWQIARQIAQPDLTPSPYPELTEVLRHRYPQGQFVGAILATPMQGDYLMWALAPRVPVTYAHIHLFHPDFWAELGEVAGGGPRWWELLEQYNVNLVVFEPVQNPHLRERLLNTPGWKVLLDELDAADKPITLNRQFIAVRERPLLPTGGATP